MAAKVGNKNGMGLLNSQTRKPLLKQPTHNRQWFLAAVGGKIQTAQPEYQETGIQAQIDDPTQSRHHRQRIGQDHNSQNKDHQSECLSQMPGTQTRFTIAVEQKANYPPDKREVTNNRDSSPVLLFLVRVYHISFQIEGRITPLCFHPDPGVSDGWILTFQSLRHFFLQRILPPGGNVIAHVHPE